MTRPSLGIRWTIGDVSDFGFDALRLSIAGALRLFGPRAKYAVYVNSVPVAAARRRCGEVAGHVDWHSADDLAPRWLLQYLSADRAQGAGWKLAPIRAFAKCHELALDNDVILWAIPDALARWLRRVDSVLVAEDVRESFGQFGPLCGAAPRNLGIRGLPPNLDFEQTLERLLREHPVCLTSELDEQGLQLAALQRTGLMSYVVSSADVAICSPFPPHVPWLGRCGAHFCGLNAHSLGWTCDGRPAEAMTRDHWLRLRPEVEARVAGAQPTAARSESRQSQVTS